MGSLSICQQRTVRLVTTCGELTTQLQRRQSPANGHYRNPHKHWILTSEHPDLSIFLCDCPRVNSQTPNGSFRHQWCNQLEPSTPSFLPIKWQWWSYFIWVYGNEIRSSIHTAWQRGLKRRWLRQFSTHLAMLFDKNNKSKAQDTESSRFPS